MDKIPWPFALLFGVLLAFGVGLVIAIYAIAYLVWSLAIA